MNLNVCVISPSSDPSFARMEMSINGMVHRPNGTTFIAINSWNSIAIFFEFLQYGHQPLYPMSHSFRAVADELETVALHFAETETESESVGGAEAAVLLHLNNSAPGTLFAVFVAKT